MRAVYIESFGSIANLKIRTVPPPSEPVGSQVRVRVAAAGLNRADLLQTRGLYPPPAGYSPHIPGLEFAGIVEAVGQDVTQCAVGMRVFGITSGEAQAEFLLIDESLLTQIPEKLSLLEAATVPEAFITAHDALFTIGGLKKGESLLIHAVGSGVGLAALQLAMAAGAIVMGTSRTPAKLEKCDEFGLDHAISTAAGVDFADLVKAKTSEKGVDVILDLVGAAYFAQNLASLATKGRLVLVGLTSGGTADFNLGTALRKRATITGTVLRGRPVDEKAEATRKFAQAVVPLFERGQIRSNLDRVFAAADVVAAYEYLESNASFGKVVLEF